MKSKRKSGRDSPADPKRSRRPIGKRTSAKRTRDAADKALRQSEALFRTLFEQAAIGIATTTTQGRFLQVNRRFCEIVGYSEKELQDLSVHQLTHPDDIEREVGFVRALLAGGRANDSLEKRYVRKDGQVVWTNLHVSIVRDERNRPLTIIGVVQDITEKKLAEDALRRSEEQFRLIAENLADLVAVLDTRGRRLYNSPSYESILGDPNALHGSLSFSEIHPQDREKVETAFQETIRTGVGKRLEYRLIGRHGRIHYIESQGSVVRDSAGAVVNVVVVSRDVTGRKLAEEALRQSESQFRLIWQKSADGMRITDRQGNIVLVNEAFCQMVGMAKEDMEGSPMSEVYAEPERESVLQKHQLRFRERSVSPELQREFTLWNGRRVWFEVSNSFFETLEHRPLLLSVFRDISERKRAEKLQNAVYRIAQATDTAGTLDDLFKAVHIIIKDVMPASNFYIALYDQDRDILSFPYFVDEIDKPIPPGPPGRGFTAYVLRTGKSLLCDERTDQELRGRGEVELIGVQSPIWLGVPLKLEQRTIGVMAVQHYSDPKAYTERELHVLEFVSSEVARAIAHKRAEDQLRLNEERFRLMIEGSEQVFFFMHDARHRFLYLSPSVRDVLGYEPDELLGKSYDMLLTGSTTDAVVAELTDGALADGHRRPPFVAEVAHKDGHHLSLELVESPVAHDGRVEGIQGFARDITEREHAEQALNDALQQQELVLLSVPLMFYTMAATEELPTTWITEQVRGITGYPPEDFLNDSKFWSSRIHPEDRESVLEEFTKVLTRGYARIEYRFLCADGTYRWFLDHVTLVKNAQGRPLQCTGIWMDINESKRAETSLRESERRFRELSDLLPQVVFEADPSGKLTYANRYALELLGYTEQDFRRGANFIQLIAPEERDRAASHFGLVMRGEGLNGVEYTILKKDDTRVDTVVYASAIRSEGRPIGVRGIVIDITDRKKADRERRRLEEQFFQAQKLESIGTLAGGIAHDFNNILGIILGHTSHIQMRNRQTELSPSLDVIAKAVQRGADLTNQILTFARRTDAILGPLDVNLMIKELAKMLRETFPRTVEIRTDLEQGLQSIVGDPTQIHQALLNICVNARDAMPNGGRLNISTRKIQGGNGEELVEIMISDTGTGMDEETRARIFEPFFTTKGQGKGTGLGLAVAYGAVKNHNGTVAVQSTIGEGTTFRIILPLPERSEAGCPQATVSAPSMVGGHETILLVEDEENYAKAAEVVLASYGYRLLLARDGEDAIRRFETHAQEIDLVVSDLGLPRKSGKDAFYAMKQTRPDVRAVFVTGYLDPDIRSELLRAGAFDFIQKPYKTEELLGKIRAALDAKP